MKQRKELLATIEKQKEQIQSLLDILKILVDGGEVAIHVEKDRAPFYVVYPKKDQKSDAVFSKEIFEGLYSRGLLFVSSEMAHGDFTVQSYKLKIPKEESMNKKG